MHNVSSTRFNIHNEDDLIKAFEDSVKEKLLHIEQIEASRSNLEFQRKFLLPSIMIDIIKLGQANIKSYLIWWS